MPQPLPLPGGAIRGTLAGRAGRYSPVCMRSLVLIGHGSHLNGESAVAAYRYAELIRARGLFDEVIEGYWKEEPSLRQVLRTTASTDVTVIPMFISEGTSPRRSSRVNWAWATRAPCRPKASPA